MSNYPDASVRSWQFGPSFRNKFPPKSAEDAFAAKFKTEYPIRLLAYWRSKCAAGRIPSRNDLHPAEMKPLLERLSIWERCAAGADNRIRLIGTLAAQIFEKDPSGQTISDVLPAPWAERFNAANSHLYDEMRPLYSRFDLAPLGRAHVIIEQLALPLRREGASAELSIHAFARLPREPGAAAPA